jgi:hypothetical protein
MAIGPEPGALQGGAGLSISSSWAPSRGNVPGYVDAGNAEDQRDAAILQQPEKAISQDFRRARLFADRRPQDAG